MADIFISWGSPDRDVVRQLCDRLRSAHLSFWRSEEGMEGGDAIREEVAKEIDKAKLAIFLLSDQTADRPWILRELEWCTHAYYADKLPLMHIVPAKVGDLPKVPDAITALDLHIADLTQSPGFETRLKDFSGMIRRRLGLAEPLVVEAALFTMTKNGLSKISRNSEAWRRMVDVCRKAGMPGSEDEIYASLNSRYGEADDDFAPFKAGESLKDLARRILIAANERRVARGRRPVLLRWCEEDLASDDDHRRDEARDHWKLGRSLLIVDAVAMCDSDISRSLERMPQSHDPARAALLWVPPYSNHTASLHDATGGIIRAVDLIHDLFRSFLNMELPDRRLTFDIGNSSSLSHWLFQLLELQAEEDSPVSERVQAFKSGMSQVEIAPRDMYGARGSL